MFAPIHKCEPKKCLRQARKSRVIQLRRASVRQTPGRRAAAAVAVVRRELAEVVLQPAQIAPRPRAVERPVVDYLQVTAALVVLHRPDGMSSEPFSTVTASRSS